MLVGKEEIMAQPRRDIRPLRRVEYDRLVEEGFLENERVELLRGFIVPMSPQGPKHASIIQKIDAWAHEVYGKTAVIRAQLPLALGSDSEPEPDLTICKPGDYDEAHPSWAQLVVEVAVSSDRFDRVAKMSLYAQHGIPHYWIVSPGAGVEIFTSPSPAGTYLETRTTAFTEEGVKASFPQVSW